MRQGKTRQGKTRQETGEDVVFEKNQDGRLRFFLTNCSIPGQSHG
jgi:hypothetical protein